MATKNKGNVDSELRSTPLQQQADETSERQTPSHEEIRRRAYEIYPEHSASDPYITSIHNYNIAKLMLDRALGVARASDTQYSGGNYDRTRGTVWNSIRSGSAKC
jgi:hypothetical protein